MRTSGKQRPWIKEVGDIRVNDDVTIFDVHYSPQSEHTLISTKQNWRRVLEEEGKESFAENGEARIPIIDTEEGTQILSPD